MKKEIEDILIKASFTFDFVKHINSRFLTNYIKIYDNPFHNDYTKNPMLKLSPEKRVFEALAQLVSLKEYYVNKDIPLSYLYESIYDLNYRIERYFDNENVYGLSDRDLRWLSPMYKAEIFDLGVLRFQRFWFTNEEIEREGYDYMPLDNKWKKLFPEKTPVITIHILKDTDLSPEKIDEALDLARDFFGEYFSEHKFEVFLCRTWLLFPKTRDILPKDSNIAAFSRKFKIIAQNQNAKQALDRIYGDSDLKKIKQMDRVSSLEKAAYKKLDKLGVAAGIIYK